MPRCDEFLISRTRGSSKRPTASAVASLDPSSTTTSSKSTKVCCKTLAIAVSMYWSTLRAAIETVILGMRTNRLMLL